MLIQFTGAYKLHYGEMSSRVSSLPLNEYKSVSTGRNNLVLKDDWLNARFMLFWATQFISVIPLYNEAYRLKSSVTVFS